MGLSIAIAFCAIPAVSGYLHRNRQTEIEIESRESREKGEHLKVRRNLMPLLLLSEPFGTPAIILSSPPAFAANCVRKEAEIIE